MKKVSINQCRIGQSSFKEHVDLVRVFNNVTVGVKTYPTHLNFDLMNFKVRVVCNAKFNHFFNDVAPYWNYWVAEGESVPSWRDVLSVFVYEIPVVLGRGVFIAFSFFGEFVKIPVKVLVTCWNFEGSPFMLDEHHFNLFE